MWAALKVLTATLNGMDADALRQMGDFLRDKEQNVVAVLAAVNGEKITFLAVCGKAAVKRRHQGGRADQECHARSAAASGGGKPDSAPWAAARMC